MRVRSDVSTFFRPQLNVSNEKIMDHLLNSLKLKQKIHNYYTVGENI